MSNAGSRNSKVKILTRGGKLLKDQFVRKIVLRGRAFYCPRNTKPALDIGY